MLTKNKQDIRSDVLFVLAIGANYKDEKAGEVLFTMTEMHFDGISRLIGDKDYAKRIQLVATAKQPTLRLKLASGVDSLRQTKVFLEKYRNSCNQS